MKIWKTKSSGCGSLKSKASVIAAFERGFTRVSIKLDNKLVVYNISSKLGHTSEFGAILSACKNLFISFRIFFCFG